MSWDDLKSYWGVLEGAAAAVITAAAMMWRVYRHTDGRFDSLGAEIRREAARIDALEQRMSGLATRDDLNALTVQMARIEEMEKAQSRRLDTANDQLRLLVERAMGKNE